MTVPFAQKKQKLFLECCCWPGSPFPLCEAVLQTGTKLVIVTQYVKLMRSIKKRKSRQRGYINSISIIRALILFTGTRFPFSFCQSTKKDLDWNIPFIHSFYTFNLSYSFSGAQRNRKSAFKSTRRHMQCATSLGGTKTNNEERWNPLWTQSPGLHCFVVHWVSPVDN